jgi:hypothetical protein
MTDSKFALFAKIKEILDVEKASLMERSEPIPWTFVNAEEEMPIRAVTTWDVHCSLLKIQREIAEAIKDFL